MQNVPKDARHLHRFDNLGILVLLPLFERADGLVALVAHNRGKGSIEALLLSQHFSVPFCQLLPIFDRD